MTLGDRVVVMNKGIVQQIDEPDRLYREPANMLVAGFIGSPAMTVLHGVASAGTVDLGPVRVPVGRGRISGPVVVGLRPEDFEPAIDSDDQAVVADVQITEQLGPELLAYCSADGLRVAETERASTDEAELARSRSLRDRFVVRLAPTAGVRPGDRIRLAIAGARLRVFDPATGRALGLT
jgi:multiple sugar transport system ATP-binding protein